MADVGEIATETTEAVVSQLIGGTVTKAEVTKALKRSEG
jgi:F-type H+-transporting ATPase subunit b